VFSSEYSVPLIATQPQLVRAVRRGSRLSHRAVSVLSVRTGASRETLVSPMRILLASSMIHLVVHLVSSRTGHAACARLQPVLSASVCLASSGAHLRMRDEAISRVDLSTRR
jgi:hypothetical protein